MSAWTWTPSRSSAPTRRLPNPTTARRRPAHPWPERTWPSCSSDFVDQSLVTVHITVDTVRYSLLESIRVFARQRLAERSTDGVDEAARPARRHRRYYRDKIIRAQLDWYGPAEQGILDWARAAWNNILVAIETSLTTPGESVVGLQISTWCGPCSSAG